MGYTNTHCIPEVYMCSVGLQESQRFSYWLLVGGLRAAFGSLVWISARISAVVHYLPKYKTWSC